MFEGLNSLQGAGGKPSNRPGCGDGLLPVPLLGIWSAKNDGPYVCLEPWTGCATQTTEGGRLSGEKGGCSFCPPGRRKPTLFLSVSCEGRLEGPFWLVFFKSNRIKAAGRAPPFFAVAEKGRKVLYWA